MKIYKTQAKVEKDIKDGVLKVNGDVTFECSISIGASIDAYNIIAYNIDAYNIYANNITSSNIDADIIKAYDINAHDIKAYSIDANNITARDIKADNIDAHNISYYAFCLSYNDIKCTSIEPRRDVHQKPICLDGKLIITPEKQTSNPEEITIDGAVYVLKEGSKR